MRDFFWAYAGLIVAVSWFGGWRAVFWLIDRRR